MVLAEIVVVNVRERVMSKDKKMIKNKPAKIKVRAKLVDGKLTDRHYKAIMRALHGKFGRTE